MVLIRKGRWWSLGLSLILVLGLAFSVSARSITRLSAVPPLGKLKKFYQVKNFKLGGQYKIGDPKAYTFGGQGGKTLESVGRKPLRLAYIAVGTPKRNKKGQIINAVIVSSFWTGDATNMYLFWYAGQPGNGFARGPVIGPGQLIDTNKFYVVFLDALGLWGTSKPSDGLGLKFPQYNYFDMVQANYRLLRDHLKVARIRLATGVSMGAMQSYIWAVLHPEMVDAIMPVGGAIRSDVNLAWVFQLMIAAMKSDPVFMKTNGSYYRLPKAKHPNRGMMFAFSIAHQTLLPFDTRNKMGWKAVQQEVFYWHPKGAEGKKLLEKARDYDVNDMIRLNKAGYNYDLRPYLGKVKAKTLILHVKNDQWLRWMEAVSAARMIKGAGLAGYSSPLAHLGSFSAPNVLKKDVLAFFKKIGLK
jgi:homoserine O-acetyltransferase